MGGLSPGPSLEERGVKCILYYEKTVAIIGVVYIEYTNQYICAR